MTQSFRHCHTVNIEDTAELNLIVSEAVSMLQSQAPGTFIVRDLKCVGEARELAVKVSGSGDQRKHFLIQSTSRGVKLKGYKQEPVFASLSAFIYR